MFKIFYTTHMSASVRQLQTRFMKMRANAGGFSRRMAAVSAIALTVVMLCATIAFAAIDGLDVKNGTMTVNGKSGGIDIIYIENRMATHTDSFYVPLRETFEALGYTVHYNVDKSKYGNLIEGESFPSYTWGEDLVKTETDVYMYGATGGLNAQMPIIEMVSPSGDVEYCQLGSTRYSMGYTFTPPALIDGRAYLPIRAVANIIGGPDSVKWNDGAHDTYYEGAVTFDEEALTMTIDTNWSKPAALTGEAAAQIEGFSDMQSACIDTVKAFFTSFAGGDGEAARVCGTARFLERQFNNNMLFYQPRAELTVINSVNMYNDGNLYVRAEISDDFADRDVLIRMAAQPGGTYLIDDIEAVSAEPHELTYNDGTIDATVSGTEMEYID